MKPSFKLNIPGATQDTSIRIWRADTRADLGKGSPVYTGAYVDTYTDESVIYPGLWWYRVEYKHTGGEFFIPLQAFSYMYIEDFGPFFPGMPAAFSSTRKITTRGCGQVGVMLAAPAQPTQALVTNWPALVAAGCSVADSPSPNGAAATWEPVVIEGQIYLIPWDLENIFRVGNTSMGAADVLTNVWALTSYLNNPATTANVYTFGGYKYKAVAITEPMARSIGNSWLVNPPATTPIQYTASSVSRTSTFVALNEQGKVVNIDNTGTTLTFNEPTGTVSVVYVLIALKYIGPA